MLEIKHTAYGNTQPSVKVMNFVQTNRTVRDDGRNWWTNKYIHYSQLSNIPNLPIVPRSLHDWPHAHSHSSVW